MIKFIFAIIFCSISLYSQNDISRVPLMSAIIVQKTNQERRVLKLDTLTYQSKLDSSSLLHCREMALNHFFSHINLFNPQFQKLKDRVGFFKYNYKGVAENIAFHETSISNTVDETKIALKFMDEWMHSKGHFKNISNPQYKETGVNIIKIITNNKVKYYAVQNFGVQ